MIQRPSSKSAPAMKHQDHRKLWRMVEGAVYDALQAHSDYLTDRGSKLAVSSITKRVVGQLVGHASEARKRRPLGAYEEERDRAGSHGSTTPASVPSGSAEGSPAACVLGIVGRSPAVSDVAAGDCARSPDPPRPT